MDDLLRKWRFKFTWAKSFSRTPRFDYSIVGARGGLNLHITDYGKEHAEKFGYQFSGGLEVHSRTPMYDDAPPSHDKCWLLHCPCWHDGTSLYVSETVIPMWIGREHDFEFWHSFLAGDAEERFNGLRERYGE